MKNEKGYALVLVLLIITITFIFALSMSTMALSSRKQINKTDELNRATDLAEMGVAHYEALLTRFAAEASAETEKIVDDAKKKSEKSAEPQSNPDYDGIFLDVLTTKISNAQNLMEFIEGSNSYEITYLSPVKIDDGKITVFFTSEGFTGIERKTLNSNIKIMKKGIGAPLAGTPTPNPSVYDELIGEPLIVNKEHFFQSSTYFDKTLTLNGGHNKPFIVNGNAFFNDKITIHGSAQIEIRGDAIFKEKLSETERSYSFCITGKPYLIDDTNRLIEYEDFPEGRIQSCTKQSGYEWSIDPSSGIEVNY